MKIFHKEKVFPHQVSTRIEGISKLLWFSNSTCPLESAIWNGIVFNKYHLSHHLHNHFILIRVIVNLEPVLGIL